MTNLGVFYSISNVIRYSVPNGLAIIRKERLKIFHRLKTHYRVFIYDRRIQTYLFFRKKKCSSNYIRITCAP